MTDLPAPPGGWPVADEPEPRSRRFPAFGVSLVVFAIVAATLGGFWWLSEPAPVAAPKPTPAAPANNTRPCEHATFDANYCAVKMVQGASQTAGVSPYTVVSVWCAHWSTRREQRRIVRKWVEQGAHPDDAQAVLDVILRACPTEGAA